MGPDSQQMDYSVVSRSNQVGVQGADYMQAGTGYANPRHYPSANVAIDHNMGYGYDQGLIRDQYYGRGHIPHEAAGHIMCNAGAAMYANNATNQINNFTQYHQYPAFYEGQPNHNRTSYGNNSDSNHSDIYPGRRRIDASKYNSSLPGTYVRFESDSPVVESLPSNPDSIPLSSPNNGYQLQDPLSSPAHFRPLENDDQSNDKRSGDEVEDDEEIEDEDDNIKDGEEEESENWEDEDDSDLSDRETQILEFETNFFSLVNDKVADTESFFDNEQYILNYVPSKSESKECTCKHQSSTEILSAAVDEDKQCSHVECQTDEELHETKPKTPPSTAESARLEINQLRIARESLVNQRKELADFIKQSPSSDADSDNERKIYGFEEAIEAIDSVVDYKNEIICGREYIFSNTLAPGAMEANLVSRLKSLSVLDLQRLYCKLFAKVVEFRYSTKKLESQIEDLEIQHTQVNRRVRRYQNDIKDIEDENASRIKDIIECYSKDPGTQLGEYLRYSKTSKAARKKQQDLELSLTELLVKHGYLRDGADYDVKQIVKMLGIDPLQLKLYQMEDDDDKNSALPAKRLMALGDVHPSQGLSRRMREAVNNRRERPATPATGIGTHREGRSSSSNQNRRAHHSSSNGGGQSTSTNTNSHSHNNHHHHQPDQYSSRTNRQSYHPGSSRYQTDNHDSQRHGCSGNINGQSPYPHDHDCGNNNSASSAYLPDRRHDLHHPPQPPSNQMLGAEVRRHDKKITIIPRRKQQQNR